MRKILLTILWAALLLTAPPALAQKSKLQLDNDIDTMFPDNTVGAITPGKLRTVTKDIVASYVDWLSCTGSGGLVYWSSGTPTCLPPGTAGQILTISGGIPAWAASPFTIVGGSGINVGLVGTTYTISCTTFTSVTLGCVPASGGGTVNFLRADGSWTTISLTTSVTGTLQAAQMPALTGDVTTPGASLATTLATVNANVGTHGSSTSIPSITVNGKGLVTAASGNAVVAPAGTLTGATLAAGVTASSLTSVGALTGGSATTGFTINASNVTWSGTVPGANVAIAANTSGAPSATFGVVKCDGTTITCASGVITSIGSAATAITVGATTIGSGTPGRVLYDNAGVLGELPVTGTGNAVLATSPTIAGATLSNPTLTGTVTGAVTSVGVTAGTGITQSGSPVTSSGNITVNVDVASASNIWSSTSSKIIDAAGAGTGLGLTALTDSVSGTVGINMATGVNFSLTMTAGSNTRALGNPSNTVVGRCGVIWLVQNASGPNLVTYGSNWKFPGGTVPAASTTASAVDMLSYCVRSSTFIAASLNKAFQ